MYFTVESNSKLFQSIIKLTFIKKIIVYAFWTTRTEHKELMQEQLHAADTDDVIANLADRLTDLAG